jgi:Streptomycin adenylyltransferase
MQNDTLIARIAEAVTAQPVVQALMLAGSHGRGTADGFSDVDLIALVPPDDLPRFAQDWHVLLQTITPIVFWHQWGRTRIVINAVSKDWARVDMVIRATDDLAGLSAASTRLLLDRANVAASLPTEVPHRPDEARLLGMMNEFIRVLGLLPVVIGRGELVTAVAGAAMQRAALTDLMIAGLALPDAGGALHVSRNLPPDQMAVLTSIPYPQADRAQVIACHIALANAFLPRARALADRLGIDWPTAFEAATRAHLHLALGVVIRPSR